MDLKLGARMLVKSPGLTVIAVIALAVAFGAGAAYFEFVNGMIRPTLCVRGRRSAGRASSTATPRRTASTARRSTSFARGEIG